MIEKEMWQEYDECFTYMNSKSSCDFVWNARFSIYNCETDKAKEFYRQAVKALNNASDVIIEAKFIMQNLNENFGYDGEFIKEIGSEILNMDMTPFEHKEIYEMLKAYISNA